MLLTIVQHIYISCLRQIYKDAKATFHDSMVVLSEFKQLRPRTRVFTNSEGSSELLLCIYGEPVPESSIQTPVLIWVPQNYPAEPPNVFLDLEKLQNARIRISNHIDSNGRIFLPILNKWDYRTSTLQSLLIELIHTIYSTTLVDPVISVSPDKFNSSRPMGNQPVQSPPLPPLPSKKLLEQQSQSIQNDSINNDQRDNNTFQIPSSYKQNEIHDSSNNENNYQKFESTPSISPSITDISSQQTTGSDTSIHLSKHMVDTSIDHQCMERTQYNVDNSFNPHFNHPNNSNQYIRNNSNLSHSSYNTNSINIPLESSSMKSPQLPPKPYFNSRINSNNSSINQAVQTKPSLISPSANTVPLNTNNTTTVKSDIHILPINQNINARNKPPLKPPAPPSIDILTSYDNNKDTGDPRYKDAINQLQNTLNSLDITASNNLESQVINRKKAMESALLQFENMYKYECDVLKNTDDQINQKLHDIESQEIILDKEIQKVDLFKEKNNEDLLDPNTLASAETIAINQLYELVATDYALTDSIQLLSRLLSREIITLEIFVKKNRELARKQFLTRVHINKITQYLV
ncbi:hypothetical protein TBLA_0C01460 [Henningerozyma blattae CBS 6284]|uniref:UEV domain-containing protein n=1 Tax=Henningerozyma blattae (strain ATCC 34711 / CBS 6284 / DSM 70876 / NBRC 10599 / NRRL Y-10934 / UCD 77-7) TaxID=1071380 RepID=I2H0Q9_HENB6|nr:hypothetical protein TBLA_0C01460 [Tetrapisispora blattae CBS 6284]CCH59961.1 hypothetical protein TBLA_0C01460 [Tetrapisispora blattae CBS 6284]